MKSKLMKLAKMIMKLAEIETDKGVLVYEGDLIEGTEVFIEKEGEMVPAEDGEYKVEERTIVVEGGVVKEIVEVEKPAKEEPKEEVVVEGEEVVEEVIEEEPKAEDKDARIAELEAKVAELEAIIAEKDAVIAEQQAKLEMSADESPKAKMKKLEREYKDNPALKYFEAIKK